MRVVTKFANIYIETDALMIHTARYNPVLQNTMFKGCNLKYLRQRLRYKILRVVKFWGLIRGHFGGYFGKWALVRVS